MLATSPHSGSARFAASLHLVTKDVVWNAAGPSKQLKAGIAQNLSVGFASTLNGWCNDVFVVMLSTSSTAKAFGSSLRDRTAVGPGIQNGQQPRESALRQICPLRCLPTLKPRAVVPLGQRP